MLRPLQRIRPTPLFSWHPFDTPNCVFPPISSAARPTDCFDREFEGNTQFSRISTRFWSKGRSYRKQTTKPLLPGATTAQCDAPFVRDFCANFALAELDRDRPPAAWGGVESCNIASWGARAL